MMMQAARGPAVAAAPAVMAPAFKNEMRQGRWVRDEHARFLQGLQKHGQNWAQVALFVRTRSDGQVRAHAKKYFAKVRAERALAPAASAGGKAAQKPPIAEVRAAPVSKPAAEAVAHKLIARFRLSGAPMFARQELLARQMHQRFSSDKQKTAEATQAPAESKTQAETPALSADIAQPMGMAPRAWLAAVAQQVRAGEVRTPEDVKEFQFMTLQKGLPAPQPKYVAQQRQRQQQLEHKQQVQREQHAAGIQHEMQKLQEQQLQQHGLELQRMQEMWVAQQQAQAVNAWHDREMDLFLMGGCEL